MSESSTDEAEHQGKYIYMFELLSGELLFKVNAKQTVVICDSTSRG